MFKFIKTALGGKTAPLPEEELKQVFTALQNAKPEVIVALRYRVNHLYDALEIERRLTDFLVQRMNKPEEVNAKEHLDFIGRLFTMERQFAEKKMNVESIAAKLIALDYACYTVSYENLPSVVDRKRAMNMFRDFRETGVINLNPRTRHIPPV